METSFFIIWFIFAIVAMAIGAGFAGFESKSTEQTIDIIGTAILVSILLPLIIIIALALSPFIGLYYLGKYFSRYNHLNCSMNNDIY